MINTIHHKLDLCVVGGGLSGMFAAIAAARKGLKVALMHERPVLGGNASSEIRMWVCGSEGEGNRETGILEEINMENLYRNPYKNYSIWDSILYEKVRFESNIELLLNCSCIDAKMDGDKIKSVTGWQMTTQTMHCVEADYFCDSSGDSILAPLTNANYRVGRESKNEFNENTSIDVADKKTMGMSCLIQARKTDVPSTFIAPLWAKKLTDEEIRLRHPNMDNSGENFWYLELGGDVDSIHDTEKLRDELLALAFGMWDYVKNGGDVKDAELWQLEFIGFLPGKRESRRMVGKYIMNQNDILSGGKFDDIVAYGGWPMDDHHPQGFYHAGNPNTWGATPTPYGIPYRCLYSENIENLYFAGRNISMTHAAMSSARVMATCAMLGQAVGVAASIACKYKVSPHGVYIHHIKELQSTLMDMDCFLPYNKREVSSLCKTAHLASSSDDKNIENLRNGIDRNNHTYGNEENGFVCDLGGYIEYRFDKAQFVSSLRFIFDSDLDRVTLPGDKCERYHSMRCNVTNESPVMKMPETLLKEYIVEYMDENGVYTELLSETNNLHRLVVKDVGKSVTAIRLKPIKTWKDDAKDVHIFSFDVI